MSKKATAPPTMAPICHVVRDEEEVLAGEAKVGVGEVGDAVVGC